MRITQVHKGDMVRIRQWEDMEQEFGLNDRGSIICPFHFSVEMKSLCGEVFRVVKIRGGDLIILEDHEGGVLDWNFSAEMLESPDDLELIPFDKSEISVLLGI